MEKNYKIVPNFKEKESYLKKMQQLKTTFDTEIKKLLPPELYNDQEYVK